MIFVPANSAELAEGGLLQVIDVIPWSNHKVAFCIFIKIVLNVLNVFFCFDDLDNTLHLKPGNKLFDVNDPKNFTS